jgi:predicted AAA+ superfamily ATPase
MLARPRLQAEITSGLAASPIVALLGPRQSGKTTLARLSAPLGSAWFDLEDPRDAARLQNPMLALSGLRGVCVLDEVQRAPELFPVLRVLADRPEAPCRFLILGSASPALIQSTSESLAGRVRLVEVPGLSLKELAASDQERLWLRGGFPRSFLADSDAESDRWRRDFIATFLERDLPALGIAVAPAALRRFWTMIAHSHGTEWNGSAIGSSLGVSHTTSRRYLDLLTGAYVLRQLQPWFENVGKRVTKSPKVYLRDPGLLHSLLGLPSQEALFSHPVFGPSWEGFCLEQLLTATGRDGWFWRTHAGAELDLLIVDGNSRLGFEFKASESPRTTKSMHIVREDLRLTHLAVVYPGVHRYPLAEGIEAMPLVDALALIGS